MRLRARTGLILLLVAGLPLALAGWAAIRLSEEALRRRTAELHLTVARLAAAQVGNRARAGVQAVRLAAAAFRFDELSPDELRGALRLAFRQIPGATAVVLLGPDGQERTPPVYLERPSSDPVLADRPALAPADVARFARHIPLSAAREVGAAIGPVYAAADGSRVTVAVREPLRGILAVELSLPLLIGKAADYRFGARGRVYVVDGRGRVVLDESRTAMAAGEDRSRVRLLAEARRGREASGAIDFPGLGAAVGAAARDAGLDWTVVVAEPTGDAVAGARLLGRRTLLWILLAMAGGGLLGVVCARSLTRPLLALHRGAVALGKGELGHRAQGTDRRDELGELARAFNTMAVEIESWRRELETRVEDKTRELTETRDLLLQAQSMAAIGQLGAGVAHEINNPLTGVLGFLQLAIGDEPLGSLRRTRLERVEREAQRIREVVEGLRRMADERERLALVPTDLHVALDRAVDKEQRQLDAAGVKVVRAYRPDVPSVLADPDRLAETFVELLANARTAMAGGGTVTLTTELLDGWLARVRVADTGNGIPQPVRQRVFEPFYTTKKDPRSLGLGLAHVHRTVTLHGGMVRIDEAPGGGALFSVTLPVAPTRTLA